MPDGVNKMELILNDLSIHGQFHAVTEFREAVDRIISMRKVAQKFGRELYCHRNTTSRLIDPSTTVFDAIQTFTREEKRVFLSWFTRQGPFWEDVHHHNPNDWLQCGNDIVTETAVGEVAHCSQVGIDYRLVSLMPSDWEYSPIIVTMLVNGSTDIYVENYWDVAALETALQVAEKPVSSWRQLESVAKARFQLLHFSENCFRHLDGYPFGSGSARGILSRLDILNQLMGAIDNSGQRTSEGHRIYQDHFTGENSRFSDSSDTEKREFTKELTFPHPTINEQYLLCAWHGKVNNKPPIRIHFAWPEQDSPLYVVYIGKKRTMQ